MKTTIITSIKSVFSDRLAAALVIALILLSIGLCAYVGVSLRPSDLQVAVHYTAFGDTSFYRDKWYYLITLIGFGLIVATVHTALVVKLYTQGRRQIALLFAWLSLLIIVIAFLIANAILKIAFL